MSAAIRREDSIRSRSATRRGRNARAASRSVVPVAVPDMDPSAKVQSDDARLAANERHPHALRLPDGLHLGARLRLVHAKHIATIAVEEGRNPSVRDAVDVNRDIL